MNDGLSVYVAEVYAYNEAYKDPNKHFSIDVLIRDKQTNTTRHIQSVIPANNNFKQLPIIGENVLIFLGYNNETKNGQSSQNRSDTDTITRYEQWYYLNPVNIRFNTTENISFSNSSAKLYPPTSDTDFIEQSKQVNVSPLQPYLGDILFEGRWGNTIRLGSTSKSNNKMYSIDQPWKGSKSSDSIIILSNSKKSTAATGTDKKFRVEDIQQDQSSLYLTTTQKLTSFKLGTTNKPNPLRTYQSESKFELSQLVGVADRVIMKSKTDVVVLDSPKAIVLNTTGMIKLGNDKADQPLPHGRILYQILQKILNQFNIPILAGSAVGSFMNTSAISSAQQDMKQLLNNKFFITKNT